MLFDKIDVVVDRLKARVVSWCTSDDFENDPKVGPDARVERSTTRDLMQLRASEELYAPIDRDQAVWLLGHDLISAAERVLATAAVEVKAIDGVER